MPNKTVEEINEGLSSCTAEIRQTQLWPEDKPDLLVKKMTALVRLHYEREAHLKDLYDMI